MSNNTPGETLGQLFNSVPNKTNTMAEKDTFITKAGLKKITDELEELNGTKRVEIAKRIKIANDMGDLSENAEYSEAKAEQSLLEGRVLEIQEIIRNATIITQSTKGGDEVQIGSTVVIKDGPESREYNIVGSNEADPAQGRISNESPLGQAFIGKKKGEILEITVPQGIKKFEIIEIK